MHYQTLLAAAKKQLDKQSALLPAVQFSRMFEDGAQWMFARLKEMDDSFPKTLNTQVNYERYGWMKYGVSAMAFLLSVLFLGRLHWALIPLSVLVFYFFEVHFLFLFPLLTEGVAHPIRASIRLTYKIGIARAVLTVMPIGFFMLMGLCHRKEPYKNWYIGCLAILTWYHHETRNRLSSSF